MTRIDGERPAPAWSAADPGAVAAVLSPLGSLDGIRVSEHVAVFEEVLTGLEALLSSVLAPAEPSAPSPAEAPR